MGRGTRFSLLWQVLLPCLCALVALVAGVAVAQERGGRRIELPGPSDAAREVKVVAPSPGKPLDYSSAHFTMHTDLPAVEARALLRRLETMLGLVSRYWGQKPSGTIECYVVADLANWPADALDPAGRAKVAEEAGVTLVETLNRGRKTLAAKAVVYAYAGRGTPLHEAVHAYCGQTFGRVGPLWYSEGMAELGQYWRPGDSSVECPDYVIEHLRGSQPKPLREIVAEDGVARPGGPAAATGDSWQNYAWRWALCHLLENNPNYKPRFRPLGMGYLTDQRVSFAETYGPVMAELAFEYRFFVTHVENGFRADLCSWDWSREFKPPDDYAAAARVMARRGWQPSGVLVSAGQPYDYTANGTWRTGKETAPVTADGARDGSGRLEGVILNDFTLGEPFALGTSGTFRPASEGRLYLRCRDRWSELADNTGYVDFRIERADSDVGPPAPTLVDDVR